MVQDLRLTDLLHCPSVRRRRQETRFRCVRRGTRLFGCQGVLELESGRTAMIASDACANVNGKTIDAWHDDQCVCDSASATRRACVSMTTSRVNDAAAADQRRDGRCVCERRRRVCEGVQGMTTNACATVQGMTTMRVRGRARHDNGRCDNDDCVGERC